MSLKVAERRDLTSSHHTHTHIINVRRWVCQLTFIVVVISQYMCQVLDCILLCIGHLHFINANPATRLRGRSSRTRLLATFCVVVSVLLHSRGCLGGQERKAARVRGLGHQGERTECLPSKCPKSNWEDKHENLIFHCKLHEPALVRT